MPVAPFPPRDLGPAENWGRTVEKKLNDGETALTALTQRMDSSVKATEGTLSTVGQNVNDINTLIQTMNSTLESIQQQQNYLASLTSRDVSQGSHSTGTLVSDSQFHFTGPTLVLPSIPVATGKLRTTISCSEVSIATPASGSVIAVICYAVDGVNSLDPGERYARLYSGGAGSIGATLTRVGTLTVDPGVYNVRARMAYWAFGTGTKSIFFADLRLIVDVIGAD